MILCHPPRAALEALLLLERAGFSTFFVGGCVRDSLRGVPPHDWDLCTAARPELICRVLDPVFSIRKTGLKHGTITATADHLSLEITTFRTESSYTDRRHPDCVTFVSKIEDDLARRDFTVNAMAWNPQHGLCDPFHGRDDLAAGVLRCVGTPEERFSEDALRILRALRFSAVLGLAIEPQTAAEMHRQKHLLDRIANERLRDELQRILCGRFVGRILRMHADILAQICPELRPMFGFKQHSPHHLYDVWEHTVQTVEAIPSQPVLRLAALLHDMGKPSCFTMDAHGIGHFSGHQKESALLAHSLLTRLRFDTQTRDTVVCLVEYHDHKIEPTPASMRRWLSRLGENQMRLLLMLKKADCVAHGRHQEQIAALCQCESLLNDRMARNECFSLRHLAVNGRDMLKIGLRGPQIGAMLQTLLSHVLEHPSDNQKERLLAIACQMRDNDEEHCP